MLTFQCFMNTQEMGGCLLVCFYNKSLDHNNTSVFISNLFPLGDPLSMLPLGIALGKQCGGHAVIVAVASIRGLDGVAVELEKFERVIYWV